MQPHPSADNWIKALLSKALPTRARPSFFHQEAYTSLLASSITQQTEEARRRSPTEAKKKKKATLQKLISLKKQKLTSQIKGQDKTPEKQLNELEISSFQKKNSE